MIEVFVLIGFILTLNHFPRATSGSALLLFAFFAIIGGWGPGQPMILGAIISSTLGTYLLYKAYKNQTK